MPPSSLQIAFQADQNYVDGLVATLCGVALNLPRFTRIDAHVIDCGIHRETRQRLGGLLPARFPNLSLHFLSLDAGVLAGLPFPEGLAHANRSVYGRLFLPDLLPKLARVIYLDCDLVVDADLSTLADLPLQGAVVAAAVDVEMRAAEPVFNSGVMIMDLAQMRATGLTRRALEIAGQGNTRHGDQTLLNALLPGQWLPLPQRWNRQVFLLPEFSLFRTEPDTVWHIYMGRKPWHFHRVGARGLVADYYDLLDRAGWTPTAPPLVHMLPSSRRDQLKGFLAAGRRRWRKFRQPAHRPDAALT